MEQHSVIYEDNQGAMFLSNNRQVSICTNHIDICHHFLQDMVEEKDVYIQYIWSEDNPAEIITNNTFEADFERNMRRVTEGEIW